jgi:tetratricopeptide (TPR) repeat protein
MYGNVPFTVEVQKINEDFIKLIEAKGSRESGARRAVVVAWSYYSKGDLRTAMKRFNQAWLLNPNNPEIYFGFGCISDEKNNFKEAIEMYTRAININPDYAYAYSNRGLTYYHKGNTEKAIADFTKAMEIEPGHAQNYNDRAACYAMQGEFDKSWSDLQKAQELGYKVNPEFIKDLKKDLAKKKK